MAKDAVSFEEEFVTFYHELGAAISIWANVEHAVLQVALSVIADDFHIALSKGYFSIENFRSKIEFIDKIMSDVLDQSDTLPKWEALADRTRAASALRNKLAHRMVITSQESKAGRRLVLSPWIYETPKFKTAKPAPPPGSLGLRDVVKARFEFYSLSLALMNFSSLLRNNPAQYPASDEQPMHLPTTLQRVRQIHAILAGQL